MLFTTSLSFVLSALLCASHIAAMPVQAPTDDLHTARSALEAFRRSQLELDQLSSTLMRRTRGTATPAAANNGGASSVITLCKLKGVGRRSLDLEPLLYPRAETLADLDPTGAHKVTHVLNGAADGLGERMPGGGSNGEIFFDPHDPKLLIKHWVKNAGNDNLDEKDVVKEIDAMQAVKLATDPLRFKYLMGPSRVKAVKTERLYHVWIWMHALPGTKMRTLLDEITDKTKKKTFLDKVLPMVLEKAYHHAEQDKRVHLDITAENVLVVMKGEEPESVNIIDWGLVQHADCTPTPREDIKTQVTKAFSRFYE